jgi:hypothetical protein
MDARLKAGATKTEAQHDPDRELVPVTLREEFTG